MDISRWPLDKKLMLPNWCFGQQWWIGTYIATDAAAVTYFMIEDFPPDVFVLWDVLVWTTGGTGALAANLTLRLCRETPTAANIKKFTRLMRQMGHAKQEYEFHFPPMGITHLGPMKVAVEAVNDGVGGAMQIIGGTDFHGNGVGLLISAIPREVPDWIVSGLAGMR